VVRREMGLVPYKFVKRLGRCSIQIESEKGGNAKDFRPEEVAGFLMSKLKRMAEAQLGREIKYAVVTVPGHFNDVRRSYAKVGANFQHAGFRSVKVVDEPIAAAAAYSLHNTTAGKVIFVFHLGGRTTHATKFTFQDGGMARLLGDHHDDYLGGDDFTGRVVDYFVELIREKHHRDIGRDEIALRKLRAACESAKKTLSDQEDSLVSVQSLLEDGVDFTEQLTRTKFEELNRDLLARAMDMVDMVVRNKDTIDEIILVGGSVRIPKVAQLFRDYFHAKDLIIEPDAVVRGAALLSRPESEKYVTQCYD
jgi:heat shock protein 5